MSYSARSDIMRPDAPDRELRVRLFWTTLLLAVLALVVAHVGQRLLRHPVNSTDPATGELISGGLRHTDYGQRGVYLAEFAPRRPNHRMVVMLGNSVFQSCEVVARMQREGDRDGHYIDLFNLGLAGCGMHDYLVELGKVVKHKPDLVVVSFINLAFTSDLLGKKGGIPRFRTDADQMAFDPEVLVTLPSSFYTREFTLDAACGSIASTVFPFKRLDPILQIPMKRKLEGVSSVAASFFKEIEPGLPRNDPRRQNLDGPSQPYPEAAALLKEFIDVASAHDVPVLFIRQETGPAWATPDIMPALRDACARYDRAFIVDFSDEECAAGYPDGVHPMTEDARDSYARRHCRAVVDTLAKVHRSQ